MVEAAELLLCLFADCAQLDPLLFGFGDLLSELLNLGGVTGNLVGAGLHPFAQIADPSRNRFALA